MPRLINRRPGRSTAVVLSILPFFLVFAWYLYASQARQAQNAADKLLPPVSSFVESVKRYALTEDPRTGKFLFWADTAASLKRLLGGIVLAAVLGLVLGLATGAIPFIHVTLAPFVSALSMVPPLAVLPILFIIFGLDELSKVMLIIIGITPFLIRDIALRTTELPDEQLTKIQTLGASTWQIIVRVILPQIMPRLLEALRLAIGPAFLFLIAAEAISANEGLGYRIFVLRRYMAMDVILPYVLWITFLAFSLDWSLKRLAKWVYPWYYLDGKRA